VRIRAVTARSGENSPGRSQYGTLSTPKRRAQMKPSTKDELEGKLHETKGKVKEKVAQVINNPDMEVKGRDEKLAGKVQKKVGQVEKVLER
jgi:uncharacterized protein YjbJ (UPF0337 family)